MNIVYYATPFFLLAILLELGWGIMKKNNTYRLNDSINSLNLGMISTLNKLIFINIGGLVFINIEQDFALFTIDLTSIVHWIIAILVYDFCYYWFHRISHERQLFWGGHVVHHQSEDYNLSTALRQTSTGFILTWIFFIPCFFIGMPISMYVTIASAHLVYQFWIHSRHIPKLGILEKFLITPSNHRVHHAQNKQYVDKNYGGLLIVWDRFFGTYAEEDENEEIIYGLRTPLSSWNPIWANIHIYINMAKDIWRTEKASDKFTMLWSRTGWRPTDVADKYPSQKTNLNDFNKYGPLLNRKAKILLLSQYLLLLFYFSWFMLNLAELSYQARYLNIVIMTLTAIVIGSISDKKQYALAIELIRITVILLALLVVSSGEYPSQWMYLGSIYLVCSSVLAILGIRQNSVLTS
ncbi:MAG: alkylglycerol monooxygenase [Chitinophagales bacterium]|jgi:alkylglycerol monooxygenase